MGVEMQPIIPVRDLVSWWEKRHTKHRESGCVCTQGGVCSSLESLARALNISHSTLFRRLNGGRISMAEADQWAVRLGQHPSTIWHGFIRRPVHASLSQAARTGSLHS